jgi:hypothetical protein
VNSGLVPPIRAVHAHTARGTLVAGLERYYPFGRDNGKGAAS